DYASQRLGGINWLTLHGKSETKGAIFSFAMDGAAHPHDISTIIDRKGVAVRAGHHCCQPLMEHLGVTGTCRASFALYNTTEEVDKLVDALELCHELLG
ncbi:MAG: aminotransferase class V-fold PLP-dependent enzyme, partial [Pseudomonadota bacterium]